MNLSKPSDGVCPVCKRHVGRPSLVTDHCHKCGPITDPRARRGFICNDCNTALTEHLEDNWLAATDYLAQHECTPRLLDVDRQRRPQKDSSQTRQSYLGNGPNDPRFVRASVDPAFVTIEQLAALWGVSAGTARDFVVGRRGRTRNQSVILTSLPDALNHIKKRWNL